MNTHSTPDTHIDSAASGRRGFLGTISGLLAATAALPLLPASAHTPQPPEKAPPATDQQPFLPGNAFFD